MLARCVEHGIAASRLLLFICVYLRPSADAFIQVDMCGQAAAMGEQVPNCDAVFVLSGEGGDIKLHGCVEVQTISIDK